MFQFVPVYFSTFVLNFQADFLFNNEFDSFKRQRGFKKIVAFHGLRSVHPISSAYPYRGGAHVMKHKQTLGARAKE